MIGRSCLCALLALTLSAPFAHAQGVPGNESIAAVVNGEPITGNDVENRAKLFALSTGMEASPAVLARLRPQVTRQLIDEKLRLQEIERRHIVVGDSEIAAALKDIESRNGLPEGGLRGKLGAQGVAYRTLVDQIRVQIGWSRALRQQLGTKAQITDAEVDEEFKRVAAETGQPEYRVADIFIPIENPAGAADARRFADTVIGQLRGGASFGVVAAQFSQSQNALQGGDEGWTHANQLDPAVATVAAQMPVGAISNPLPVAGGLEIVTLRGRRGVGRDMQDLYQLRQVFLPFTTTLNPQAPTAQQKHQLDVVKQLQASVHSCAAMEAANKSAGGTRPANPGDVRLDQVNPPSFRALLQSLQPGEVSKPLVAPDGIGLVMVCGHAQKNVAEPTRGEIHDRLQADRVELASRQLQRSLEREAVIDRRPVPAVH